MIKSLSGGPGVTVNNGGVPHIYVNMSNPSAGMLRFNGSSNNIEVYDGYAWLPMASSHASVDLDSDTLGLLEWARKKQREEKELEQLAATYPAIKDLNEKLAMVLTLVRTHEKQV